MNRRGTGFLVRCRRSVSSQIVGEIDRGFLDIDQCFGRNAFGINHVMAFEFDVKEFEFVILSRLIAGDGRAIDQQLRRNQYAIDQQSVSPRHVEIGMRNVGARAERAMRTGSASLTQGFDGSLFLKG